MEFRELQDLKSRLARVETRLRFVWSGWVLSVLILLVVGLSARQAYPQTEVLKANTIEAMVVKTSAISIVDRFGTERISINPLLISLQNEQGEQRLALSAFIGPSISMRDHAGRPSMTLSAARSAPRIVIWDEQGRGV